LPTEIGVPHRLGKRWFISLAGDPGVGKTTLAASAPDPLFIDVSDETMVLAYTPGKENTPVVHCRTPGEVSEVVQNVFTGKIKCGTLILDNMTDLQGIQLHKSSNTLKTGRELAGTIVPIIQDYGISTVQCRDLIREFFMRTDFPSNVIVITHLLEVIKKGETTVSTIRASLTEKLAGTLYGAVQASLVLSRKWEGVGAQRKEIRTIRAAPTSIIQAKNRLGLPEEFPADQLWSLLEGKK
jgi:hypothetical protein